MDERQEFERALLPCPFCGGTPKPVNFDVHKSYVGYEWVECTSCGVMVEINNTGLSGGDCRAKLVAKWNARAALAAPQVAGEKSLHERLKDKGLKPPPENATPDETQPVRGWTTKLEGRVCEHGIAVTDWCRYCPPTCQPRGAK